MTIAREFAARICAFGWPEVSERALNHARLAVADALACTLAGAPESCTRVARDVLSAFPASGPCVIAGTSARMGPLEAALINGTACHALDFDDCSNTVGGHPTASILWAALALSEVLQGSGRQLLCAYVVGFETMAKLARGVHLHHYQKGWHPTATLGVFGATAACCHLLGLDEERTAQALCHTASVSAGLKANFGSMTKPLHVGYANRNGLFSAQLAANGVTAGPEAFEHPQGFFEVFNGAGTYAPERCFESWAAPLDLSDPGIALKAYPCCASTHPAIDAALQLRDSHGFAPDQVEAVLVRAHERRLAHTDRPAPRDGLDAKFSVQYVVARALLEGRVGLGDFDGVRHTEERVERLMSKVAVAPHQDENHFGAYVTVKLADGRAVETYVPTPLGRDESNPLPTERFRAKFDACCAVSIAAVQADELWRMVHALEDIDTIGALTAALAGRH